MSGSKRPLRRLAYDGPMKYFALIGLAVSLGMAAPALAQYQPSNPAAQQQFEQMRGQMQQIRANERAQALNALTPQHRAMLSTMAGQLAASPNPDVDGAVRRLDAILSPAEKQAVMNAVQNARSQQRALFANMRAQSGYNGPQNGRNPQGYAQRSQHFNDVGYLLLRLSMPGPDHMGRPPMQP